MSKKKVTTLDEIRETLRLTRIEYQKAVRAVNLKAIITPVQNTSQALSKAIAALCDVLVRESCIEGLADREAIKRDGMDYVRGAVTPGLCFLTKTFIELATCVVERDAALMPEACEDATYSLVATLLTLEMVEDEGAEAMLRAMAGEPGAPGVEEAMAVMRKRGEDTTIH